MTKTEIQSFVPTAAICILQIQSKQGFIFRDPPTALWFHFENATASIAVARLTNSSMMFENLKTSDFRKTTYFKMGAGKLQMLFEGNDNEAREMLGL